jgi:L-seryl-tRNA(Ser) seleniumtransferase
VVNATGVVIHTNLGRAPLAREALRAVEERLGGYVNVEMDLATGERGRRAEGIAERLRRLTGAPASLVVNNNAAAVLLALDTLARGREVVVSRGELVEIGGAFRVPDVMARSGATLVEVGTTNRTRLQDYARAIGPGTAALLKVHPSNFRIVGFTEEAPLADVAGLARERGVASLFDLGSGALRLPETGGRRVVGDETTVAEALAAGADLVMFSGDKLLGGPQAGIVVGREDLVALLKGNPLYRALRVDKLVMTVLEATLAIYEASREREAVPVQRMLATGEAELEARARRVLQRIEGAAGPLGAGVGSLQSAAGGGSAPLHPIPSRGLVLRPRGVTADGLLAWLRRATPPIVARIEDGAVVLDFRTVFPEQDEDVVAALGRDLPGAS